MFSIDASALKEHSELSQIKFDCIHFNFPHDGNEYKAGTLKVMLKKVFNGAKLLQQTFSRVYMGLPRPPNDFYKKDYASNYYYKVLLYDIYSATRCNNYRLVSKHEFGPSRYPAYKHVQTHRSKSATVAERFPREYVFEKTLLSASEILCLDQVRDPSPIKYLGKYIIPELVTDDDTTDYDAEEDKPLKLFKILDVSQANSYIKALNAKLKKFLKPQYNFLPPSKKIENFKIELASVEAFIRGDSVKFFLHTSRITLGKVLLHLWYYRAQNYCSERAAVDKVKEDTLYQYFNLLKNIIQQCSGGLDCLSVSALEAVFYLGVMPARPLYGIRQERCLRSLMQLGNLN